MAGNALSQFLIRTDIQSLSSEELKNKLQNRREFIRRGAGDSNTRFLIGGAIMESGKKINYEEVLLDLENQKSAIESAITGIKLLLGKSANNEITNTPLEIHHDTFFGMSISDATKKYLLIVGKPARKIEDIVEALNKGGLESPKSSINTVLNRVKGNEGLVKIGKSTWGLQEWYPNKTS